MLTREGTRQNVGGGVYCLNFRQSFMKREREKEQECVWAEFQNKQLKR